MNHEARKLVVKALLSAASALSALTDRRLEYALPGLAQLDQKNVLWIVFNAIGLEQRAVNSIIGFVIDGKRFPMTEEDKDGYKAILEYLKDDLAKNTVVDAYIPWLANQFKKGNAQSVNQELVRRFRAVCIWASETKTDLVKLTAQEALAQSEGYISNESRKAADKVKLDDSNPVIMTFADGWFIRQLKTDAALEAEGKHQGHCVGDYCEAVQSGESIIYSLRTPDDVPRVTIETQQVGGKEQAKQMFGRENSKPTAELQKYLIEFVEKKLRGDAKGLLLAGKQVKDIDLKGADFLGADLKGVYLVGADLTGAYLYDAYLDGANLTDANLTDANLYRAKLIDAKLIRAILIDAILTGAHLRGAVLTDANLTDANLQGAKLTDAILTDAILTNAILTNAILTDAILTDAILTNANLRFADLTDANLTDANLSGADLRNAILEGADLTGADLRRAGLEGVDLIGAVLTGANLEGVRYNDKTTWPKGFDPPPSA